MNRLAEIKTPLPEGKLLFYKMEASERLAQSFSYEIDLLSEDDQIAYSSVLGQKMTVALQLQDGGVRHFDGYVVLFGLTGRQGRYFVYHASVRPWTWFLSQTQDCRVFQGRSAVENTKFVFGEHRMAKVKDLLVQATAFSTVKLISIFSAACLKKKASTTTSLTMPKRTPWYWPTRHRHTYPSRATKRSHSLAKAGRVQTALKVFLRGLLRRKSARASTQWTTTTFSSRA
jgi:Phage tail baseplate hub (GPD)